MTVMRESNASVMCDWFERSPGVVAVNLSACQEERISNPFGSDLSGLNGRLIDYLDGGPEAVFNWDSIPSRSKTNVM